MRSIVGTEDNSRITLYTIGFEKKCAEEFFEELRSGGVKKIVDVRLRNTSQISGYTKQEDLIYFLRTILGVSYIHLKEFAPSDDLLDGYRRKEIDWQAYEVIFNISLELRRPESFYSPAEFDKSCLLCLERSPVHCHRRLVAERFQKVWNNVDIIHL